MGYGYSNWKANEPNDFLGGEYCTAMYAQTGRLIPMHVVMILLSEYADFCTGPAPYSGDSLSLAVCCWQFGRVRTLS